MAKSALPIAAAAGAAVLLLMPKKKPKRKKTGDNDTSGVMSGWGWRVRKDGDLFFGEVRKVEGGTKAPWLPVHDKGRPNIREARLLAWERIAQETAVSPPIPSEFNWEPARAHSESELRKEYPGVTLAIMEHGSFVGNSGKCNWAIMSVSPRIPEGGYAGFLICPSTGESQSRFSDSIPNIKSALEIG